MLKNLYIDLINKYESIVIMRHTRPDGDAFGSQLGLKQLILDNFNNKKVYAVGDYARPSFLGDMDELDEDTMYNSLLLVVDTCVLQLMLPYDYSRFKAIAIFDHHENITDLPNALAYYDVDACSACQIVAKWAYENNLKVSKKAATCLYNGMVTDSNRFNYSLSKEAFEVAGLLIESGAEYQMLYDNLYLDSLKRVKMKAFFESKFMVSENGVGFMFNDASVVEKFNVDTFAISRGMVNVMANIKEVKIWCNFTEDSKTNKILCEFRSRDIPIVEIAKKYGGGGHLYACGAAIDSFDVAKNVLADFEELAKGR